MAGQRSHHRNGQRIGKLEDLYFDIETDEPQFGTVKEGFLDRHLTFVPLTAVTVGPDNIQVAVTKEQIKTRPTSSTRATSFPKPTKSTLYHYFEMNYTPSHDPSGRRLARH